MRLIGQTAETSNIIPSNPTLPEKYAFSFQQFSPIGKILSSFMIIVGAPFLEAYIKPELQKALGILERKKECMIASTFS